MVVIENFEYVKKASGRPKLAEDQKKPKFNKKEYMKAYMKEYNQKNSNVQYNRRNTAYYIKKFNIGKEFIDKYGIFTANLYKCTEDLKKISNDCPMFLENMKELINELQLEKEKVAELEKEKVAELEKENVVV